MFEKFENPRTRRGAAASLIAAAAVAGFAGRANAQEVGQNSQEIASITAVEQSRKPYEVGAAVLEAMNKGNPKKNIICNCAVVFPAGTPIERAPMSALAYKVKPGSVLLGQRPRLYKHNKNLWAGFWKSHAPWTNQASDSRHYLWVNLTKASKKPGYEVYNYANYNPDDSRDYPFTFPVTPNRYDHNNLVVTSPSPLTHSNEIAVPTPEPKSYISTELNGLNLVPAKRPVRFIEANAVPPINPDSSYN